jgi:sugar lactone lactonase YvrE
VRSGRLARQLLRAGIAAVGISATVAALAPAPVSAAPGDTSVFARIGAPGYPAHAYVHPDGRVYEGTYVNHSAVGVPSKVLEFPATGGTGPEQHGTTRSWTVPNQDTSAGEQGVQVATSDARGRLVLLDRTPARALLLDRDTGAFSTYARFPDLKPCSTVAYHEDCEPGGGDELPMPNYAAWLPDGSLLVTDYQQDVIWRVPPGGGTPTVWLGLDRFAAEEFGLAGIALSADRKTVLTTLASNLGAGRTDMLQGKLLEVPLLPGSLPGTLRTLWTSGPLDLPDGFAISKAGNVYVALVGASAQVVKVGPGGQELARFGTPLLGANGSPIPFDGPSSARFQGSRLLVANQSALFGVAANQAILAVETGEVGVPELIPAGAGTPPPAIGSGSTATRPALRVVVTPRRLLVGRRTTLRLRVTAVQAGVRRGVARARVRLAGRSVRTDARGRATVTVRRTTTARVRVVATATGFSTGRTSIAVRRR